MTTTRKRKTRRNCEIRRNLRFYLSRDEHDKNVYVSREKPENNNGYWMCPHMDEKMRILLPGMTYLLGGDIKLEPNNVAEVTLMVTVRRYNHEGELQYRLD